MPTPHGRARQMPERCGNLVQNGKGAANLVLGMDDLLATGIRLEASERRPNGFVLNGRFVPYRHVYKGSPAPHVEISRSSSSGELFVRWEVQGLPADAPDGGDITGLWRIEKGTVRDDPPGWWKPPSS